MVAAAISTRARATAVNGGTGAGQSHGQGAQVKKSRGSAVTWVIIGVPVLLALTLAWQIGSSLLRSEIALRDPVAVSRVSLEPDPLGSRIDFVVVDRSGQETTVNGDMTIKLREPDGTVWQTARTVTAADFGPLSGGGLLTGRRRREQAGAAARSATWRQRHRQHQRPADRRNAVLDGRRGALSLTAWHTLTA